MKDMTLGQIGRALARYQPFIAAALAIALIVVFAPGRENPTNRNVTAGPATTAAGQARTGGQQGQASGPNASAAGGSATQTAPAATGTGTGGGTAGTGTSGGSGTGASSGGTSGGGSSSAGGSTAGGDTGSGASTGDASGAAGSGGDAAASGAASAGATDPGQAPAPGGAPAQAGAGVDFGPECDLSTGRLKMPLRTPPPCVPVWDGRPGGSTYQGVTDNEIVVAVFRPQVDPQTQAILTAAGADDTREQAHDTRMAYIDMWEKHLQTYGRKIKIVNIDASGESDDDAAGKADAIKVATEVKAFVSFGDPNNTYVNELAARGVLCLCTVSQPAEFYVERDPFVISSGLMASTFGYVHRAEYIGKRLWGKEAKWALDADLKAPLQPQRSFGLVYYETADNAYKAGVDFFEVELAKYGAKLADRIAYILDVAKAQEDAGVIIGRLKSKKITSVVFSGDPLMPIFLTNEANNQRYNPEWIITGSALTDTNLFGRTYNKNQWNRAFGVSFLSTPLPETLAASYRLHQWHTGRPPQADDTHGVIYPNPALFMMGVHLAGPNLTPWTFRDAMFSMPPQNGAHAGSVTTIGGSFGNKGLFPFPDYTSADDTTEIWWDNSALDPDDNTPGMSQYVEGGKRYLPGQWPASEPRVFVKEGAVTQYNDVPEQDRWTDYPHQPHG